MQTLYKSQEYEGAKGARWVFIEQANRPTGIPEGLGVSPSPVVPSYEMPPIELKGRGVITRARERLESDERRVAATQAYIDGKAVKDGKDTISILGGAVTAHGFKEVVGVNLNANATEVVRAVRKLQREVGVSPADGIFGPKTYLALIRRDEDETRLKLASTLPSQAPTSLPTDATTKRPEGPDGPRLG